MSPAEIEEVIQRHRNGEITTEELQAFLLGLSEEEYAAWARSPERRQPGGSAAGAEGVDALLPLVAPLAGAGLGSGSLVGQAAATTGVVGGAAAGASRFGEQVGRRLSGGGGRTGGVSAIDEEAIRGQGRDAFATTGRLGDVAGRGADSIDEILADISLRTGMTYIGQTSDGQHVFEDFDGNRVVYGLDEAGNLFPVSGGEFLPGGGVGGGGGGGSGRFLFPEESEAMRLQNELQRRILAGELGFQEVRPGVWYDPLTDTLVDENQLEIDRRAQLESEAGFVRDVLANPADFLFRAALTRGQTSAVPRLTQADILNQFNQDISGARSGFGDALGGAFTPNFLGGGGSRFSDPRFVEAVNQQAQGLQNRLQTVDQAPASLQNRLQQTFQNQLDTIGQQTGTATPLTQDSLADLSRQVAPPAVRDIISGEDPGALQLPFEVPTQAALNNLTQSESQALNTALGAEFGIGLEEAAAASRQRFQPVRSSRKARLVV